MSYAGHVFDMINRLKENAAPGKLRRERYRKLKQDFNNITKHKNNEFSDGKHLTTQEIELIKTNIRKELKNERKKETIKAIIVTTLIVIIMSITIYHSIIR